MCSLLEAEWCGAGLCPDHHTLRAARQVRLSTASKTAPSHPNGCWESIRRQPAVNAAPAPRLRARQLLAAGAPGWARVRSKRRGWWLSSARAWQRAAKAAVCGAFPPDTEPEQTSRGRFIFCSVPLPFCFRKTPFRKDVLRPEGGGKALGACTCFPAACLPRAEVFGPRRQGGREGGRQGGRLHPWQDHGLGSVQVAGGSGRLCLWARGLHTEQGRRICHL